VERGGLSPQGAGRNTPGKETWCPLFRRLAGLGAGFERTRKIWFPAVFEPPYRKAGSELLYRLRYPGRPICMICALNSAPTQNVDVYSNRREYTEYACYKLKNWTELWQIGDIYKEVFCATFTANWRSPLRSYEMELNCETSASHKLYDAVHEVKLNSANGFVPMVCWINCTH
jgi:hypothetical protein